MKIAFYAPMKAPSGARPSGDRQMARLLIQALRLAGHEVTLASSFRSWDGTGDRRRQERLCALGGKLAPRLIRRYRAAPAQARPTAWFTYHLYHKAPDWLGPRISQALAIPYLVAEASFAPKQAGGPWMLGHEASSAAIARADAVIALNSADVPAIMPLLTDSERLIRLKPFLDTTFYRSHGGWGDERSRLARQHRLDPGTPWLLTVAMMRSGDKLASYRILATCLTAVRDLSWQLVVIGDGPVWREVHNAFADFAQDRVRFLGLRTPQEIRPWLRVCDLFIWPAIKEAYGMALLEAQASGLAVVAGGTSGVCDIVEDGGTGLVAPEHDAASLSQAVRTLLQDPQRRNAMAAAAARKARAQHDIVVAADRLNRLLERVQAKGRA